MSKNIKVVKIDTSILPLSTKKNKSKKKKMYSNILSSPKRVKELLCKKQNQNLMIKKRKTQSYEFKDSKPSKILSMINNKKTSCLSGNIPDTIIKKIERNNNTAKAKITKLQTSNIKKIEKNKKYCNFTIPKEKVTTFQTLNLEPSIKRKFSVTRRRKNKPNKIRTKIKTKRKYSSKTIDEFITKIKNSQTKNKNKQFKPENKKKLSKKQDLILKTIKYILRKGDSKLLSEYIKKMNKRQAIFILKRLNIITKPNTPTSIVKNILLNTLSTNIRIIKY